MAQREWLPKMWGDWGEDKDSPFHALRKQVDTLFDDFDSGFPIRSGDFTVRTNVSETDGEVCITAELPGIEMSDVDVEIAGDKITIRGEKKSEKDDQSEKDGRTFHRIERSAGSFMRTTRLPFDIDPDKVAAGVKNGVLTVTIPKPAEEQTKTRKIEINEG
ncbi:Hsp20/alpha crystallin family protein [Aliiroseovarius sp. M344]|uniref:Hsp20/alpha crystallin family protein n=1 Tax=Aliiroseovarius sp. M344 TaxID=2867010 RepID=UPI0021AE1234|nr:Hsp20/alpha crystallin family protein [Aliiroseovarius sp. M344]UWQ13236.1 Hsp20/alpha crystallin family protein [Aliiroseovarius sp. M344]